MRYRKGIQNAAVSEVAESLWWDCTKFSPFVCRNTLLCYLEKNWSLERSTVKKGLSRLMFSNSTKKWFEHAGAGQPLFSACIISCLCTSRNVEESELTVGISEHLNALQASLCSPILPPTKTKLPKNFSGQHDLSKKPL